MILSGGSGNRLWPLSRKSFPKQFSKLFGDTSPFQETFKRIVNPSYIIILSLISSLLILKLKVPKFQNYFKFFLFLLGFFIIIFSELSYKFVSMSLNIEILFISMPILFIILFYLIILLKTNFKPKYL